MIYSTIWNHRVKSPSSLSLVQILVPVDACGGLFIIIDSCVVQLKQRQLQRNAGVRKRKYHIVNGHKFEAMHAYGVMKCGLSGEYLMTSAGFRCDSTLIPYRHVGCQS